MLVEWYVARTNQIATLGYVSRTNYITAFAYLEPITTFRVCVWHKSDCRIRVYISHSHITAKGYLGPVGAAHKESQKTVFVGSIISLMVCGLRESLVE